jgi:hypothetical protein
VIDYSSATQFQKRMVLASLDKLKLTFCHFERICELSSVQLPNVKDSNLHIYGPFETNLGEVDLVLGRDFAFVWQNGIVWDMNSMIYQKGHARLSFSQMTLLDWEDCIENNGYKSVAPFHFFPLDHGWLRFENDQWVLQPDVCFFNEKGIRLFRRTLKDTIRIEVDFWHEKDSFFKRYLMSLFGGLIESYTGIRSKTDKFFAKWTFETLDTRKISLSSVTASCLLLKQSSDLKRSWYEKRRAHCEPVVSDRSESQWQSEEGCWTLSSDDRKFTITKK